MAYLPTKLGHLRGKCWDSYSSTMDPMGLIENDKQKRKSPVVTVLGSYRQERE